MRSQYDDIINKERPRTGKRGHMTGIERAKQFMPFAALKGFEEAVHRKEKQVVSRTELAEESMEEMDHTLREIALRLEQGEKPMVCLVCFVTDRSKQMTFREYARIRIPDKIELDIEQDLAGEYIRITGIVTGIDVFKKQIRIADRNYLFENIREIAIKEE